MRAREFKRFTILSEAIRLFSTLLIASALIRADQPPIKHYTTADGLPSTSILRVFRDSRGFLWFCTRDGLSRFDGYRFVNYTMEHGLPNPTINDLCETRSGVYWIATNGDGICKFDPAEVKTPAPASRGERRHLFTVFAVSDDALSNRVNALFEDRQGRLWAGTDGGLFVSEQVDPVPYFRRVELSDDQSIARVVVWRVIEDREGSLWIASARGLVRRLPDARMINYAVAPLPSSGTVVSVLEDRDGRLWFGHGQGLFVFKSHPASQMPIGSSRLPMHGVAGNRRLTIDKRQPLLLPESAGEFRRFTTADGLPDNDARAIHQSADGRIWICTLGGLASFDGKQFRAYTSPRGLNYGAGYLAEDRDGNLWIGSSVEGAMKLALNGLTTFNEMDGLGMADTASAHTPPMVIRGIYENERDGMFVVSGEWNINLLDGRRFRSVQPALPAGAAMTNWVSQACFLDRTGRWWLLTTKGVFRFPDVSTIEELADKRADAVYTPRDWVSDEQGFPYRLYEDSRGDIWIWGAGTRGGLVKWKRVTATLEALAKPDGLSPANIASTFCEDRSGSVWIGLYLGGLVRSSDGRMVLFSSSDGLPVGGVTDLYHDRAGRIWIATSQGGLGRINDPLSDHLEFIVYTTDQGLGSNNVRCITEDLQGHIYVGTARSVDQLNPDTGQVRHYTTGEGLANDFVTVAFRDRRGDLWFGTRRGLSRFIPSADSSSPPPSVWIGALQIAGEPYAVSELGAAEIPSLELGPTRNHLQIEFFGLGFRTGDTLRYQVKLEGADRDWGAPTAERTVNYASLQPGGYRFLVRAVTADGIASATPAVIVFRILPPIWQRWWFLTIVAVLVAPVFYRLYRYRLARLIELERVRTRIATDLHDDIGSSLSQISVLSEVVHRRVGKDPRVAEPLSTIADLSRGLVDSMSDIVWAINPDRDRVSDLSQRMRRFASDVFTARNIEFRLRAPEPRHNGKLGADTRRETFLIFKECVNNIVRHSNCTEAVIDFAIEDGTIALRVNDNGSGFDPESASDGNGLTSMRRRAAKMGGTLDVISRNGDGTTVKLKVPLR